MATAFVRQLGYESGVQLNPLVDASEIPATGKADQVFGIIMRATRGRIDKPFVVDSGNVYNRLGSGETIRKNALNEAWVHVVEALNRGAYEAVVMRVVGADAVNKWASVSLTAADGKASFATKVETANLADATVGDGTLLFVKHVECFNDGFKIGLHVEADELDAGWVYLRLYDAAENKLFEFRGSLDPDAKDDYGNSAYLPDVVTAQTDLVEVSVAQTIKEAMTALEATSLITGYDYNAMGARDWYVSPTLVCFTEGATTYTAQQLQDARVKLQKTPFDYAYISSGGSKDINLLNQLAQLAFDTNRQLRFDIDGSLTPEAAIAFKDRMNPGSNKTAHLLQAFWSPFKSDDISGVNPNGYIGTATLNIAYACGRNAVKNAKGFAAKNYPIAGRNWPVERTGLMQTYFPSDKEFSQLAKAKINPVIYDTYTGGGRYVFKDSLTCALVESSLKKLISVADMSSHIDDAVTRAGKDYLQLPMQVAIRRMSEYLQKLFEDAQASGWLVPSNDPTMGGAAFKFEVVPDEQNPYDQMVVNYWLRYDGTVRQIYVTQTITK